MAEIDLKELKHKTRFMGRYRKNQALIFRLENKLFRINQKLCGLRSPKLSDMPKGSGGMTVEDLLSDKLETEERINNLNQKGRAIRTEILNKIDELDDARYAEILESYYIGCKYLCTIAEDTGYSVRHVSRLFHEALAVLHI